MINYLSKLLEKNANSQTLMVECFNKLNLHHLLAMDSNLVDEAIIDMLKNILAFQPSSSVILEMCASLLDFKLSKKPDSNFVQFWLFSVRAAADGNASIPALNTIFQKYSGYGETKKDYIVIDFFKIIQEGVLLNFFASHADIQSLMSYVG